MLRSVPQLGRLGWIALLPSLAGCASVVDPASGSVDGGILATSGGTPGYATGGAPSILSTGGFPPGTGGIVSTGGVAGSGGSTESTGGSPGAGGVTATGGTSACFLGICASGGASSGGSTAVGGAAGGTALSCDNAICWDVFDCVIFHPDLGACGFTKCENFVCKK